uniref:plasminogen-like isoform X1 n=1 Tax=Styela clava TaxID=7725 RepID=UPI0019399B18|nr:plasminogen-like isoform X1 [Styela clava]
MVSTPSTVTLVLLSLVFSDVSSIGVYECVEIDDPLGVKYRGTQSQTRSGIECQRWTDNSPHRRNYWPPNPETHENYCRNPDGESEVWCYTTDVNVRWEYCDVPKCPVIPDPASRECYLCNGYDYVGDLVETASGKTCQRWDSSTPHQHNNHPSQKPDRNLVDNFCRNPDGDTKPWCYTTDQNIRWENCAVERCTNADGSVLIPPLRVTSECIVGAGGNYRGTKQVTRSGKTCAQWTSQFPHKHKNTPENYPCSGLDHNYCRNPTASFEEGPWCYTTDPNTRWELCELPECGPDGRPLRSTATPAESTPATTLEPGSCGKQAIQPTYFTQGFAIEGGRLIESRRRKREIDQQERILGGDIALHGSWPWSVSMRKYTDFHFCGGTLIKPGWVVTAAHCLDDELPPDRYAVKAGLNKGTEVEMQKRNVRRYILHGSYSRGKHDIALVQLETPFIITKHVRVACLPEPDYEVPGGSFCVVTGWGRTYDDKPRGDLKQAVLPVHSYEDCNSYLSSHYMGDKTQMCAGWKGEGVDTCKGDSGGPLVCLNNGRWTLQGVTSWGPSGCQDKQGNYGSYSRVSKYMGWIKEEMAKYS